MTLKVNAPTQVLLAKKQLPINMQPGKYPTAQCLSITLAMKLSMDLGILCWFCI